MKGGRGKRCVCSGGGGGEGQAVTCLFTLVGMSIHVVFLSFICFFSCSQTYASV